MFVFSFKTSKKQILSMLICVLALIAVLVIAVVWPSGGAAAETLSPVVGKDDQQRIAFLTDLGYTVDSEAPSVREVLIPDEFDDVFQQYNELQKDAGMDLEPYHGKRVKCWTYKILNVPGEGEVRANLYVYKDKIIGGDISSTALDGFMHGLTTYTPDASAAAGDSTTTGTQAAGTTQAG